MATKIGPKTVSQRDRSKALVFCIDAANSDSYGGEPTTNLLQYPESIGSGPTQESWSGTITANAVTAPDGTQTATKIVATSGHVYERLYIDTSYNGATFTTGDTITYSIWVKTLDGTATTSKGPHIWNYNSPTYGIVGQDLNGIGPEWKLFKVTHTVAAHQTNFAFAYSSSVSNGLTGLTYAIWHPQLEVKSNSTPYVKTSRTASNAVKNISGVGALGTTLTGTFAAYGQELFKPGRRVLASLDANKGHIGGAYWDFDGTDEYINAGTGIMTSEFITISLWVKYGGNSGLSSLQGMVTNNSTSSDRRDFNVTADKFQWIQKTYSDGRIETSTANGPDEGVWTHAVATSKTVGSDTLSKIYKNSIEVASLTYSSVTMSSGINDACFIGYLNSSRYFNGEIACVSVWSSCLTAKEIKDIYIAQKGRFGK